MRLHPFMLFLSLLVDGGAGTSQPTPGGVDAGTGGSVPADLDGGSGRPRADAGVPAPKPIIAGGIRWPEDVRLLTTLDAPAVLAAHAALQALLARFEKEGSKGCGYSPKGLEVVVGEGGGMYIVRINQRMDKCGWVVPEGFGLEMDWAELYAVSPEGKVLARYPFAP